MIKHPATGTQRLLIQACLDHGISFFWFSRGTLLIERSGLDEIVPVVISQGATVLGFEGFELESADIHPRIDLIFDASFRPDIRDPLAAISNWPNEIWVDVALKI